MASGLTHYTRDVVAVSGILANGFAWMPNPRRVIKDLIPHHDFSEREPQQFGMVSLTESPPPASARHREAFGELGIVVSWDWARSHRAQRVLYLERSGPVFETLQWLFRQAYEQLEREMPFPDDAAARMAFSNKAMAGVVGGALWGNLLHLYEYMEPAENSYQGEWRIVHPHPYYSYGSSKEEVIRAVSPPQGWAQVLNVLRIPPEHVLGLVSPRRLEGNLRDALPVEFRDLPFTLYEG